MTPNISTSEAYLNQTTKLEFSGRFNAPELPILESVDSWLELAQRTIDRAHFKEFDSDEKFDCDFKEADGCICHVAQMALNQLVIQIEQSNIDCMMMVADLYEEADSVVDIDDIEGIKQFLKLEMIEEQLRTLAQLMQ